MHLNPLAQISKFKFSKLISIQLLKDLVEEIWQKIMKLFIYFILFATQ